MSKPVLKYHKEKIRYYEKLCCKILKQGEIPNHIAFIMDGNRRFAVSKKLGHKSQGHSKGFESLKLCLEWCLELGVNIVSVFAFAIENFKREPKEVEVLMKLAKTSLREMADENEFLQFHQIKVNIIGDLELLPKDVQIAMQEIMELTKNYKKMVFNVCFAYNSDNEVQNMVNKTIKDKQIGQKQQKNLKLSDFQNNLMIKESPGIIVRTSNEIRLSNFLTFQSTNAQLHFLKENWPEISIFSMLGIILRYQLQYKQQQNVQKELDQIDSKLQQQQIQQQNLNYIPN